MTYDLNIGQFIRDHPRHIITAPVGGFGYQAQLRDSWGRGTGPKHTALTLDELAALLAGPEQGQKPDGSGA